MARENASEKGRRLLTEARVRVLTVSEDDGYFAASVRGDSARVYAVSFEAGEGWRCTCPARSACSHVRACQLVAVMEPREAAR